MHHPTSATQADHSVSTDGKWNVSRGVPARITAAWLAPALLLMLICSALQATAAEQEPRPNVILVMTDDQGYGDVGVHGNMQIRTPYLDKLHGQSVRLTNYHVDPTCSPTRSALMTGRYSTRTGVWHTIQGRSMMAPDETTIAEVLSEAGYRTGIFGKWHLGDNYPLRPQDQGFQEVLIHGGGGVTQTPDYWGNDYFGDTYFHNGHTKSYTDYCTDVWFDGALKFIQQSREKPFFCYIPTNAPHGPFLVADKYSQPYKDMGIESPRAEFYGMITNIDENLARLDAKLHEWGLAENTIFIFTTDNGTAAGARNGGFNAGMRGNKGSEYDGGHRVPFFIRWPKGRVGGVGRGRDVPQLTAHIDILPTLAALCGVKLPGSLDLDGRSLTPLLGDLDVAGWPERTLVVHSQRIEHPEKWRKCAVMTDRWRLINGRELYDMQADPGQKKDVATQHPDVTEKLRDEYEQWWKHIGTRFDEYVRITLGYPAANPTELTCHDWHEPKSGVPWNQGHIQRDMISNGFWTVNVERAGEYEFTLRTRPEHVGHPMQAVQAGVEIADQAKETAIASPEETSATIRLRLPKGPARLKTWLKGTNGKTRGAYFVEVKLVP